ncbi:MAG: hypothetical protein N2Z65_02265 [Clostridiales bacterium]|nr:hypothetical protein [Clostridiales bacterium]
MKLIHRIFSGILAAAILMPVLSSFAYAGPPVASADEAVYANLDYYGKISQVNIVKGYSLNGNGSFTDYGSYSKVVNMTNDAVPTVTGNSVNWNLGEETGRFYFECTPKNKTVTLPWNFDVSYKLNGVPYDAKKLAGASGLVEINVKAIPNKNSSNYYKNNMLLQVGTAVSMKDNLSVEAPGAQLQSVGDYKVVLFAGLPGEEKTYTIRIGTKDFKSMGVVMMMVPATLDQFKGIKDVKDAKDTVKDSLDSINASMNVLLGTIENMAGGLKQVQSGMSLLDRARGTMSSAKNGLFDNADRSLSDITAVAEQTETLLPHLQNAQKMVGDVSNNINAMVKNLVKAKSDLDNLDSSLDKIYDDVEDLQQILKDFDEKSDDREDVINNINSDISSASTTLTQLQSILSSMSSSFTTMSTKLGSLQSTLEYLAGTGDSNAALFAALFPSLKNMIDSSNTLISGLGSVCTQSKQYLSHASDTVDLVESYFDLLDDSGNTTKHMLKYANKANASIQSLLELGQNTIDDIYVLNNTMNQYKDGAVGALKDTEELTRRIKTALSSSKAFLSAFEAALKASSGNLDDGTRNALNGMINVLGKSIQGIGSTSTIKNANNTIKKTIDDKIDKYEKENNLLNMDAEASLVSFTSSNNPTPESVQIILRTEEINTEENQAIIDLETTNKSVGVFARLRNIFIKIFESVASLF